MHANHSSSSSMKTGHAAILLLDPKLPDFDVFKVISWSLTFLMNFLSFLTPWDSGLFNALAMATKTIGSSVIHKFKEFSVKSLLRQLNIGISWGSIFKLFWKIEALSNKFRYHRSNFAGNFQFDLLSDTSWTCFTSSSTSLKVSIL